MKKIFFLICLIAWILPSDSFASNHWFKADPDNDFNYIKPYNEREGLCQVILHHNELYLRVIEDSPCPKIQYVTLIVSLEGTITKEIIFYNDFCASRSDSEKDIFLEHCMVSAKKELPLKMREILEMY